MVYLARKVRFELTGKLAIAVLPLVLLAGSVQAADKLYRYRNADGVMVIDYKVPPEYVAGGYDILSGNGTLIQRIPPHLSPEEGVNHAGSEEAVAAQREEDLFLIRSYSSVDEIVAARDRKLGMLQREIEMIERNQEQTSKTLEQEELRAANQQRSGRDVSESLLQQLTVLRQQLRDAVDMLDLRKGEYRQAEARYLSYINRYRELSESQKVTQQSQ